MKPSTTIVLAATLLLSSAGCNDADNGFAVRIEQGGKPLPIRNHQVKLRKAPFAIFLRFAEPKDAAIVNVSFEPDSARQARDDVPFDQIAGFTGKQIPERRFNPDKVLHVHPTNYGYWNYFSQGSHKFDSVVRSGDLWVCRRTVVAFVAGDGGGPRKISQLPSSEIFLTVINIARPEDSRRRVEKARQFLKLVFE